MIDQPHKFIIRKLFRVEMAHQLLTAATACCHETVHGHSYVVEVFFGATELDKDGMVIDFGSLGKVREIVNVYDHALVMSFEMPEEYLMMLRKYNKKLIIMHVNPTAEAMAAELLREIMKLEWPKHVQPVKVRLHETVTGYAECSTGDMFG